MRLSLVTETFPPEINGVAMTLGRWVEAFRSRGHQVQIIRPVQAHETKAEHLVTGLALPFYREVRIGLATQRRLRRLFAAFGSDLVHIATEGPLGWSALRAAEKLSLPVASSFHTNFDHYAGHYRLGIFETLARNYLRKFHNKTRITLVPSEGTRARLLDQGFKNVEIWSRGVDSQAFHPRFRDPALREQWGVGPDDMLLLYVGRLAPEKNLPILLEAFTRLRREMAAASRRVFLALVGGGPMAERLEARTPDGVILAGIQRGEALSRCYASADLFTFPSCSETFGNVVVEAQASGLPVVGFNCRGVGERISSGVDGLLVPEGGDFAAALRQLVEDDVHRRRMARRAREKAQAQSWDQIFDALEQRYLELLKIQAAVLPIIQGVTK